MVELASLNSVVDRLVPFMHVATDLNNVVGTIMINQQPCSYMIEEHVDRE